VPQALAEPAEKPTVLFGVIPRYNPMIMYRSYQPLMDYLTENTPYRFELKLARDYTEAVALLREGVTPIASLGDVTFTEAQRNFGAVPILRPLNSEGHPYYHSIIIVREDSPILTLQDLKGKTFAFGDPHSTSGNLIPRYLLFKNGITLFDLKEFVTLGSHDAVAKAVLKGKFAAGAVKDVIAYRYREHGLRFLAESHSLGADRGAGRCAARTCGRREKGPPRHRSHRPPAEGADEGLGPRIPQRLHRCGRRGLPADLSSHG
jgi:phosphonate transport system substrate-binding protein